MTKLQRYTLSADISGRVAANETVDEEGKWVLHEDVQKIKQALVQYINSEGCGCCENDDEHEAAEKTLAELFDVPRHSNNLHYDWDGDNTND